MNAFSIPSNRKTNPHHNERERFGFSRSPILEAEEVEEPSQARFQERIPPRQGPDNHSRFVQPVLMLTLACLALNLFSYVSSGMETYQNIGNLILAIGRTVGVQLGILGAGSITILVLFTSRRVEGLTKGGCYLGSFMAGIVALLLFVDSASTSFSYQDYKLGTRTGDERSLEASLHQYQTDVAALKARYASRQEALEQRHGELLDEKARLDAIVGPAVASGTNLKRGYSESLASVTRELSDNAAQRSTLAEDEHNELTAMDKGRSADATQLRASNSSGVASIGRMLGWESSTVILCRTLLGELPLIILSIVLGAELFYMKLSRPEHRRRNTLTFSAQMAAYAFMFTLGSWIMVQESKAMALEPTPHVSPEEDVMDDEDDFDPAAIDTTLLRGPYDDDGLPPLPQANATSIRHRKPSTQRWSQRDSARPSVRLAAMRPQPTYNPACPIPSEVFHAINARTYSPRVKAILAATAFKESTWNPNCYHYDNGGYAHGLFCLHGKWRKKDVAWMKSQPGGWRCPSNNLDALLRTIKDHQTYYPATKTSWRRTLARYNGGSKPNYRYADSILRKARELEIWFAHPNSQA